MAAHISLMGADMGHIEPSAERDWSGHIRLQLRINATCESASVVMSEDEALTTVNSMLVAMGRPEVQA